MEQPFLQSSLQHGDFVVRVIALSVNYANAAKPASRRFFDKRDHRVACFLLRQPVKVTLSTNAEMAAAQFFQCGPADGRISSFDMFALQVPNERPSVGMEYFLEWIFSGTEHDPRLFPGDIIAADRLYVFHRPTEEFIAA